MVVASGRWLGVRLDFLSELFICAVSLMAVVFSQNAGENLLWGDLNFLPRFLLSLGWNSYKISFDRWLDCLKKLEYDSYPFLAMAFLGTDFQCTIRRNWLNYISIEFPSSCIHHLELDICFDDYSYHDSLIESSKGYWPLTTFLKMMTILKKTVGLID